MQVKLAAGVEVDLATRDELSQDLDGAFNKNREPKPLLFPKVGSNTSLPAGGGNGIIDLGFPPAGKIWNILSVTLTGTDDTTAVTGKAALYVDSEPIQSGLGLANLRMPNLGIPSFTFITKQTLWAHANSNVVINLTGLSGNTVEVNAILTIAEYHEWEVGSRTTR